MPARLLVPNEDLYATLEVPPDALPETIEIAWRALLKRHHPDVAGDGSLEAAKLINVAHDWLTDPQLRERYDQSHGTVRGRRTVGGTGVRYGAGARGGAPAQGRARSTARAAARPQRPRDERPPDLDVRSAPVRTFLARVGRLSKDELDRLELADTPPIAFVASIRRFLDDRRRATLEELELAVTRALPAGARGRRAVLDAATSYGHQLVLAGFLADGLSDPFRERVVDRMTRGWDAAVDQMRYGPNSPAVAAFIARAARLDAAGAGRLSRVAQESGLAAARWPSRAHPAEDEGLRISVALAERDAGSRLAPASSSVRRAAAAVAGTLALQPAYSRAEFRRLMAPIVALGLVDDSQLRG